MKKCNKEKSKLFENMLKSNISYYRSENKMAFRREETFSAITFVNFIKILTKNLLRNVSSYVHAKMLYNGFKLL